MKKLAQFRCRRRSLENEKEVRPETLVREALAESQRDAVCVTLVLTEQTYKGTWSAAHQVSAGSGPSDLWFGRRGGRATAVLASRLRLQRTFL